MCGKQHCLAGHEANQPLLGNFGAALSRNRSSDLVAVGVDDVGDGVVKVDAQRQVSHRQRPGAHPDVYFLLLKI
jgi:hypothetical protein